MDCRVASLLAETVARLGEFHSVFANPTLSFRTPPRLCERSEAIHLTDSAVLKPWTATAFGLAETRINKLPRRYAPRRDGIVKLAEK